MYLKHIATLWSSLFCKMSKNSSFFIQMCYIYMFNFTDHNLWLLCRQLHGGCHGFKEMCIFNHVICNSSWGFVRMGCRAPLCLTQHKQQLVLSSYICKLCSCFVDKSPQSIGKCLFYCANDPHSLGHMHLVSERKHKSAELKFKRLATRSGLIVKLWVDTDTSILCNSLAGSPYGY